MIYIITRDLNINLFYIYILNLLILMEIIAFSKINEFIAMDTMLGLFKPAMRKIMTMTSIIKHKSCLLEIAMNT